MRRLTPVLTLLLTAALCRASGDENLDTPVVDLADWAMSDEALPVPAALAGAEIRGFTRPDALAPEALRKAFSEAAFLFGRGYERPPTSLASDLSAALTESRFSAEASVRPLIVTDARGLPAANEVARGWVADRLAATANDRVGVLALFCPDTADRSVLEGVLPKATVYLVLVKFSRNPDATYRITRVVFGTLDDAAR